MNKEIKEWTVNASWGKIGMISWGDPSKPPILMVHGYMDSAATFILLVEQLPDTYYYVAFDMPGHGKSDPFPPGLTISQLGMVEAIRVIVEHMNWHKFVCVSHSLGFTISVLYNHLFPGKIVKMVHFDPVEPIAMYYYFHQNMLHWYQYFYEMYYDGYERWNAGSTRRFTFEEAVEKARKRNLSEDKAKVVISRSLEPVGDGKFKLSWDQRMKNIAFVTISEDTFLTIITENATPTLIFESSENLKNQQGKLFVANFIEKWRLMVPNFYSVKVTGGHDMHITHTEIVAPHIKKFLQSYLGSWSVKCKL